MFVIHLQRLLLIAAVLSAGSCQRAPAARGLQQDQLAWQTGVTCSNSATCRARDARLSRQFSKELKDSSTFTTQSSKLGGTTFMVLPQYLQPNQSNVQFAQAFCASRGGTLAFWTTPQQYTALAALAQKLAATAGKRVWHLYTGLVQLPGSKEPTGGWVWSQTNTPASSIPWGKGEPNQHNSGIAGELPICVYTQMDHMYNCSFGLSHTP
jgi:putative hemolysin